MYDLTAFGLSDLVRLSAALRAREPVESMEGAAREVVRHLYDNLLDKVTGDRSSVLVRFYKTHPYATLPDDLKAFAGAADPGVDLSGTTCLALLATAGAEPEWNDRRASAAHQAIPLPSRAAVERSPMVHRLIEELGVDVAAVVRPSPLLVERQARTYNVFHVPDAAGSPYVPAQDFVAAYGVSSVLGFGGLLPDGSLFAVVVFSRTPIRRDVAELFSTVALAAGLRALPFVGRVFDEDPPATIDAAEHAQWTATALEQLLNVREHVLLEQSLRIEQALTALEERAAELAASRTVLAESEARKAAILEASLDAIVTMDAHGTILEFNPAAEHIFGYPRAVAVGASMAALLVPPSLRDAHAAGFARHLSTGEARIIGRRVEVPALHASGREFPAELTIARIDTSDEPIFTAHVRDVTDAKRREDELRELADTLQAGLLPPTTPTIPGLEVATHYSPGGHGLRVGGDFYDVFRLAGDEWGVVVGDVCGKGARAASVTSLVRYTARAAAAHGGDPTAVLHELNIAVLGAGDGPDDRYCSAVYATLRLLDGAVEVRACSGGHPPPFVVRTSGDVEAVASEGQLIGLFEEFETSCADVRLETGDLLVLYTDGVTESRAPDGEQYGDSRLCAVLTAHAGRSADDVVAALVADLALWTDDPGDDVALVVLRPSPAPGASAAATA
ncbi:MAG TPA: SpoIIE family protein phosphatase [Mycobacteriales bacterium]|jgi:PAS domain S-box-containing protein